MRTPRILVACLAACLNLTAHADYMISFVTPNGVLGNPAYDTDGVTKLGPSFSGQLYVGSSPGALVAIGVPVQFSTVNGALNAAANGFIVANNLTVASASLFGGSAGFYQLRAWTGAATYELAIATPGAKYGASTIQTVTLGGTPAGGGAPSIAPDVNLHGAFTLVTAGSVPPSITSLTSAVTVTVSGSTTFGVAATGTAPLAYQWVKDGLNVPGATNASLSLSNVQLSQAGNYTVVITNTAGSLTSSVVALTILVPDALGSAPTATVAVFAGSGVAGNVDGSDLATIRLNQPNGLGFLSSGVLIVADAGNNLLRILYPPSVAPYGSGPYAGSGVAGFADAVDNTQARLNLPLGMFVGPGDDVFVADTMNNRIRRVSPGSTRTVSTVSGSGGIGLADGPGGSATFNFPNDLVMDPDGNIFVTEFNNHVIRKIAPGGGTTIFAGNGVAGTADGQGWPPASMGRVASLGAAMARCMWRITWGTASAR